jgi:hypothetical protein
VDFTSLFNSKLRLLTKKSVELPADAVTDPAILSGLSIRPGLYLKRWANGMIGEEKIPESPALTEARRQARLREDGKLWAQARRQWENEVERGGW